jgi:hypothetical protein
MCGVLLASPFPTHTAHLENRLTDPLLPAAQRPEVEQALATLDELKAAEMDVAFAKFGVKVWNGCLALCVAYVLTPGPPT